MPRPRPVLFLAVSLAAFVAAPALAQGDPPPGLTGVFLGGSTDQPTNAISQFNPVPGAPLVALTPFFNATGALVSADTLDGWVSDHGGAFRNNWNSMAPSMAPTGRMVFLAQWFYGQYHVMAQDRDGTNRVVLSPGYDGNANAPDRNLFPDISPDGQTAIYAVTNSGFQVAGTIYTVPTDGSAEPEEMRFPSRDECGPGPVHVVYSPDGSQIAFLGTTRGENPNSCAAALWIADADGSNARAFVIDPTRQRWDNGIHGLDWKADLIVLSNPTYPATGTSQRAFRSFDPATETFGVLPAVGGIPSTISLSPDGRYIGYLRPVQPGSVYTRIDVTAVDGSGTYSFGNAFPTSRQPIFHWADVPPVPEPARLEFEERSVLLWSGRTVQINPVLYDADGTVISRTVRNYSVVGGGPAKINHFTHELWGGAGNWVRREVCASNGGLERCLTYNNVNVPLFDAVVLDGDISEEGRNPGSLRIYRYGRPDVEALPVFQALPPGFGPPGSAAFHYLDYTLSALPQRLSWPGSDALADTLQTLDVVLTPIDDGVAENAIERGLLQLSCTGGTGVHPFFGVSEENCQIARPGQVPGVSEGLGVGTFATWTFEIASNGAGSGLGLAGSQPARTTNAGAVTLTINGQGFGDGATASLSGPQTLEAAGAQAQFGGVQLQALFDLDGIAPGTYDLTVTSGGETATLEGALVVEAGEAGTVVVWSTMQGAPFRRGFPSVQRVHYGNNGTADAYMTPIRVAFPAGAEVRLLNDLVEMESTIDVSPASLWQTFAYQPPPVCIGRGGARARARAATRCLSPDPIEMQSALFFVPTIPAGGTGTLSFEVLMPLDQGVGEWFTSIGQPLNTIAFDAETGAATARSAAALAAGATACTDAVWSGASAEGSYGGSAEDCVGCMNGVLSLGLDALDDTCVGAAFAAAVSFGQTAVYATQGVSTGSATSGVSLYANVLDAAIKCAGLVVPGTGALVATTQLYAVFSAINSAATAGGALLSCAGCIDFLSAEALGLRDRNAHDPNEKYGPPGVREEGFVSALGRVGYHIDFENLPTATASAVQVVVTDTLDVDLDLLTFELGAVSLPDTTLTPPPGLTEWTAYWDRRPVESSLVQVRATLDPESRIARWQISDLDPNTYALRTGVDDGFLPPNDAFGAGEGWVEFYVATRDDLPDGEPVENRAAIRFDREPIIRTGTWRNTLDRVAPVSRAVAAEPLDADTAWVVRFEGSDGGAGVAGYDLYAQADGGPFAYYGTARSDSLVFRGEPGAVYGFFAVATDWVGNAEGPKTEAEVTTGAVPTDGPAAGPTELSLAAPYPNPTRGPSVVQVGVPAAGPVRVAVYDVQGREVAVVLEGERPAGWHAVRWDGSGLAAGVYVVRLTAGAEEAVRRLTVVR